MMCDGGQPACNRGNGGQSRYTLFHWAPLAESRHLSQAQISRPSHLEPWNCQAQMQPAFGKWQQTRFLIQSAAVDTTVSAVNLTLNHSTTDPLMCVARPPPVLPLALAGSWVKVELSVSFFEHHLQLDYGYYRRRAANRFPAGRIPSV
jgi:hypothetical protein